VDGWRRDVARNLTARNASIRRFRFHQASLLTHVCRIGSDAVSR
jgi:hypothetical protein